MVSKTKIKERSRKKTKPSTKETITAALKHESWKGIAQILSAGTRSYSSVNLFQIDSSANDGDFVVIPGKVLSLGELTKKVTIVALGITPTAKEKLKQSKSEFMTIKEAIQKNPKPTKMVLLK